MAEEELSTQNEELRLVEEELSTRNEQLAIIGEELRLSRSRYMELYDFAPLAYISLNSSDIITEANNTACSLFRMDRAELTGKRLGSFIDQKDLNGFYTCRKKSIATGGKYSCEVSMKRLDRTSFEANVIIASPAGTAETLVSIEDITGRKITEHALKESEEKFAKAFRGSPTAQLLTCRDDGTIVDVNESYEQLFGYTRDELVGHKTTDLSIYMDPDERARIVEILRREGRVRSMEIRLRKKSGGIITALGSIEAINIGGRNHLLSLILDITERKQAEQLKDEFISMVSHELRTPLTVIIGNLKVALSAGFSLEQILDMVKEADFAAEELREILENLVQLSRYNANKLIMNMSEADFGQLLTQMVHKAQQRDSERTYRLSIVDGLPQVRVDSTKIIQIMDNLLSNAAKYSQSDTEVLVDAGTDDGRLIISVIDQGRGISHEDQERLFRSFERLEETRGNKPGLGLGLLVCKRLVEAHGGTIWVESEVDKGSKFCFILPLENNGSGNSPAAGI